LLLLTVGFGLLGGACRYPPVDSKAADPTSRSSTECDIAVAAIDFIGREFDRQVLVHEATTAGPMTELLRRAVTGDDEEISTHPALDGSEASPEMEDRLAPMRAQLEREVPATGAASVAERFEAARGWVNGPFREGSGPSEKLVDAFLLANVERGRSLRCDRLNLLEDAAEGPAREAVDAGLHSQRPALRVFLSHAGVDSELKEALVEVTISSGEGARQGRFLLLRQVEEHWAVVRHVRSWIE
jgi:hypothetical protein